MKEATVALSDSLLTLITVNSTTSTSSFLPEIWNRGSHLKLAKFAQKIHHAHLSTYFFCVWNWFFGVQNTDPETVFCLFASLPSKHTYVTSITADRSHVPLSKGNTPFAQQQRRRQLPQESKESEINTCSRAQRCEGVFTHRSLWRVIFIIFVLQNKRNHVF